MSIPPKVRKSGRSKGTIPTKETIAKIKASLAKTNQRKAEIKNGKSGR